MSLGQQLKMCNESHFFKVLEECVQCRIPSQLKKILTLHSYNSAISLSGGLCKIIESIESFMRHQFTQSIIMDDESSVDYLGIWVNDQKKFQLMSGQKRMLEVFVQYCSELYQGNYEMYDTPRPDPSEINTTNALSDYIPSPDEQEGPTMLFRRIGAHMITCYNDAKRVTLSDWSWPSRQIAYDMARNFEENGNINTALQFNFDYLTPHNHSQFVDAIVQVDLSQLRSSLRKSLAISLRVDGSVDKTGQHNIYVMSHIMNEDFTTSTIFMGFGVPQTNGAEGYFECLRKVVSDILPWSEFFAFVTSVVTDGEPLNMGSLNGLCARLKQERSKSAFPLTPLYCLWCVPHRVNLAWKSTCNNNTINSTLQHCINLAKYFRQSGARTQNLKTVADTCNLSTPLGFPAFFEIRWTEYTFKLMNAILRNYRAVIEYFKAHDLQSFLNIWQHYDRIHSVAFLADVLSLLKRFQKSCQSDSISIVDVLPLKLKFCESLEKLTTDSLSDGWEKLFLASIVTNQNGMFLHGIELMTPTSQTTFKFGSNQRQLIINSLMIHVNMRINLDSSFHDAIAPFNKFDTSVQQVALKACHASIASDIDEHKFLSEYKEAADLLAKDLSSLKECFQSLKKISPEGLSSIKVTAARILTLKPHSADVERLISLYNKFKTAGRSSLSPVQLFNYMYIYVNMGNLQQFDPTSAVEYWMNKCVRRPKSSDKRKEEEWFYGVFDDCNSGRNRKEIPIIKF